MNFDTAQARTAGSSAEVIRSFLHAEPQRVALALRRGDGWAELTYAALDAGSAAVRDRLAATGVRTGDRVGLLAESGPEWVAALLGIWRAGGVAVPFDAALSPVELDRLQERAPLAALLTSRTPSGPAPVLPLTGHPALPAADVVRDASEPALLVWTSGTTGEPKGVGLSFAALDFVVTASVAEQGATADDSWLSVLGLNHLLELCCGLLACLRTGATAAFARTNLPHELAAAMAERRVTRMMAVPLLLRLLRPALARNPAALGHLRALYSGGAPLDPGVLAGYAALGVPVYQGYGLTELAPAVAMNSARADRPGSVGRPLPGVEVRIDEGEIVVRSPGLLLGYWDGALSGSGGFRRDSEEFRTGDLGSLDADGFLYVTGRAKNLVVLESGKKVSPEEVEQALAGSELFAEAAAVALPKPGRTAEEVCVVVVPAPGVLSAGHSPDRLAEIVEAEVRRCTEAMSGYKRPTVVQVRAEPLPRTVKLSVRRADLVRQVIAAREAA